ncbi:MAG: chaperone modulator CbpM [Nitrosospira sp.]|nr:chaperone modulator CbpM [Nitrosospira sp.]
MTNGNKPPDRQNERSNEKPNEMPDEKPQAVSTGLNGIILDEQTFLTLTEISQACAVQTDYIVELVEEGLITPSITPETGPESHAPHNWRFTGMQMRHARIALHLQGDLGVNLAGAGLALQLLDEVEALRTRLKVMGGG